jgi:TPR repeat protein
MRNHLSLIVVALGLALSIGTASADDFDTGWDAYEAGEYAEAVKWYRLAAEQGDADAQSNLGFMYANGRGVPENDAEAVKWYRLAAEQGNASAQYNLALMYDEGEGVIQNNVIAHMLYNLAGAQGYKNGRKNRDVISERMTPNDISRAQEMAATCLEKNYKGCGF